MRKKIGYYLLSSNRRKILDVHLFKNQRLYHGVVLDIGGRDRGLFRSPKGKVERWIVADIDQKRNPDIVLNVEKMDQIQSESIDVINALELFEHVHSPEKGLMECHRVLKKNGTMIISCPFLYPIHADPYDFQRWTDKKWRSELEIAGFSIKKMDFMGGFFAVFGDMLRSLNASFPTLKYFGFLLYPFIDMLKLFDQVLSIKGYTTGFFIVAIKK